MDKYSSYKDSGVQWLGQVPSHWEMKRFRFLLTENAKLNTDLKERTQLQFRYGEIIRKANQSEDSDVLKAIQKYTVVAPGDIMINGLNLNYDFITQRVAQVQEPGVITSAYISLRPATGVNSKYYTYFMKAMDAQKMFHGMGSGVRLTLAYANLKNMFFPYPSLAEQEAMVAYLDAATAKIDEAITQQQQMIEHLKERKRVLISHIVTRGVKRDPELKDSGIDYLGNIPSDWSVVALRFIGTIIKDIVDPKLFPGAVFKEYSMPSFDEGRTPSTVLADNLDSSKFSISGPTLLVNKLNVHKERIWFISDPGSNAVASTEFVPIRIHSANPRFVEYAMLNHFVTEHLICSSNGATNSQKRVSPDSIAKLKLPIPSDVEQKKIVDYLDNAIKPINNAIYTCDEIISRLDERKRIIINDVVTGKIKV